MVVSVRRRVARMRRGDGTSSTAALTAPRAHGAGAAPADLHFSTTTGPRTKGPRGVRNTAGSPGARASGRSATDRATSRRTCPTAPTPRRSHRPRTSGGSTGSSPRRSRRSSSTSCTTTASSSTSAVTSSAPQHDAGGGCPSRAALGHDARTARADRHTIELPRSRAWLIRSIASVSLGSSDLVRATPRLDERSARLETQGDVPAILLAFWDRAISGRRGRGPPLRIGRPREGPFSFASLREPPTTPGLVTPFSHNSSNRWAFRGLRVES